MSNLTNFQHNTPVITHEFNNSFIEQRQADGYVNATALSKTYRSTVGKRREVGHWLDLERTKETLQHLSSNTGIPVFELYQVFQGSPENGGGTWIHPKLAIRFGIWLSDEFGYLVEEWVNNWLTSGHNSIQNEALVNKVAELDQKLATAISAITTLQAQIGNLLPPDNNFAPPGWNPSVWQSLPPQDKRHFRFLARRRGFRPSGQCEATQVALPASTVEEMKQQQQDEVERVVGEILEEEKTRLAAKKQQLLARFWAETEGQKS